MADFVSRSASLLVSHDGVHRRELDRGRSRELSGPGRIGGGAGRQGPLEISPGVRNRPIASRAYVTEGADKPNSV
jgi:hypothetical protein